MTESVYDYAYFWRLPDGGMTLLRHFTFGPVVVSSKPGEFENPCILAESVGWSIDEVEFVECSPPSRLQVAWRRHLASVRGKSDTVRRDA